MCGHWKRKRKEHMPKDDFCRFLGRMARLGTETVCLSGGDPFAHPDLESILETVVANKLDFGVVTAGGHIMDNGYVASMLRKARWVRVSLDATDGDVYNEMRGGGLHPKGIADDICSAVECGINVEIGFTITGINYMELPEVANFAVDAGVSKVSARPVYKCSDTTLMAPFTSGGWYELDKAIKRTRMVVANSRTELDVQEAHWVLTQFDNCYAVSYQMFVDAKGDIYPCCITGGDTSRSAKSYKLSSIYSTDGDRGRAIVSFRELPVSKLPKACDNCIKRLNTINAVCSGINKHRKKMFF
jgi:MoaA/NifB/PqqE/SkfB family radical SAM enzyme